MLQSDINYLMEKTMKELRLKWKQKRKDIAAAHESRFYKWVRRSGKKWHWTFKMIPIKSISS